MKIALLWVGKTRNTHLDALIQDYCTRIARFCELSVREIKPATASDEARLITLEGERLLSKVEPSDFLVALDAAGQSLTTPKFAALIARHREKRLGTMVFAIGGHAGLSAPVKQRANFLFSLSPLTLTHEMARHILAEQICRAFCITHKLPYHR